MRRKRDSRGRYLKRSRARRRTTNPTRRRRRRLVAVHHRSHRRRNPVARRVHRRRRSHTRRRHNPALLRGIPFPNLQDVGIGIAGGVGAKLAAKKLLPANMTSGWMGPVATLGAAIGIGLLLKMAKMGRLASAAVTGGAIVAGIDALKMTSFGAQLAGVYVSPGGDVPVLSGGGVGMFPPGFQDPQLAAGDDMNSPFAFESSAADDVY